MILEIEWVLRGAKGLPRHSVVASLNALLDDASLVIERERDIETALDLMTRSRHPDFADASISH